MHSNAPTVSVLNIWLTTELLGHTYRAVLFQQVVPATLLHGKLSNSDIELCLRVPGKPNATMVEHCEAYGTRIGEGGRSLPSVSPQEGTGYDLKVRWAYPLRWCIFFDAWLYINLWFLTVKNPRIFLRSESVEVIKYLEYDTYECKLQNISWFPKDILHRSMFFSITLYKYFPKVWGSKKVAAVR